MSVLKTVVDFGSMRVARLGNSRHARNDWPFTLIIKRKLVKKKDDVCLPVLIPGVINNLSIQGGVKEYDPGGQNGWNLTRYKNM